VWLSALLNASDHRHHLVVVKICMVGGDESCTHVRT
jgi:hypothetical protein